MDKKVFINEGKKVIAIVLYNKEYEITARGKAVCCDQDTFDKDLGLQLANARAWKDYYTKLAKKAKQEAEWYEAWFKRYQVKADKINQVVATSLEKLEAIDKEYQDMLKAI